MTDPDDYIKDMDGDEPLIDEPQHEDERPQCSQGVTSIMGAHVCMFPAKWHARNTPYIDPQEKPMYSCNLHLADVCTDGVHANWYITNLAVEDIAGNPVEAPVVDTGWADDEMPF